MLLPHRNYHGEDQTVNWDFTDQRDTAVRQSSSVRGCYPYRFFVYFYRLGMEGDGDGGLYHRAGGRARFGDRDGVGGGLFPRYV